MFILGGFSLVLLAIYAISYLHDKADERSLGMGEESYAVQSDPRMSAERRAELVRRRAHRRAGTLDDYLDAKARREEAGS